MEEWNRVVTFVILGCVNMNMAVLWRVTPCSLLPGSIDRQALGNFGAATSACGIQR